MFIVGLEYADPLPSNLLAQEQRLTRPMKASYGPHFTVTPRRNGNTTNQFRHIQPSHFHPSNLLAAIFCRVPSATNDYAMDTVGFLTISLVITLIQL